MKTKQNKLISWLLVIIGFGLLLDPTLATTCRQVADSCKEYFSFNFLLHAIETIITAFSIFTISTYDALLRKRLVSILFCGFQIGYGLLFVSQLANQESFNTLSQYVYVLSIILWLTWFVRDYLHPTNFLVNSRELRWVTNSTAIWAFANGIAAILISLAHIHLLGKIKAFYFAGDSAYLAQHGVIVGIIMLYLSRHLARGERRARQIFLAVLGLEVIKYSLISPHIGLLLLYGMSFIFLFILRDDFRRGTVPLTRQMRIRDLYIVVVGLLVAAVAWVISLDRDNQVAKVASRSFGNFVDYATSSNHYPVIHLPSVLLAQTSAVFVTAATLTVLWILFKPGSIKRTSQSDYPLIEKQLKNYSSSADDYFKLWPKDKEYFWSANRLNFISYKQSGPVIFALADPIGPKPHEALIEFIEWARSRRLKICFMPVSEKSKKLYESAGLGVFKIGATAEVDTNKYINLTARDKWWRWVRNKSDKAGFEYLQSSPPHDPGLMAELSHVSQTWLSVGGHTERSFGLGFFDASYLDRCTIHYLSHQGQVIAFTNEVPRFRDLGGRTIDLMRYLPQYNHSMSFLMYEVINKYQSLNIKGFDLGFVPFAQAKGPIQATAKALSDRHFSSKGLMQFKNKFDPNWQPNYLAYDGDLADLGQIALHIERVMEL